MFFAAVPLRSASFEDDPSVGELAYPPIVGRFGSFASNLALRPALVLLFSDDMLPFRVRPSSAVNSCVGPVRLGGFL